MTNELTKLEWCIVDTDNYFVLMGEKFEISQDIKEYRVNNKAEKDENGNYNEYTNDASMDKIAVSRDSQNELTFYDQDLKVIPTQKVRIIK